MPCGWGEGECQWGWTRNDKRKRQQANAAWFAQRLRARRVKIAAQEHCTEMNIGMSDLAVAGHSSDSAPVTESLHGPLRERWWGRGGARRVQTHSHAYQEFGRGGGGKQTQQAIKNTQRECSTRRGERGDGKGGW